MKRTISTARSLYQPRIRRWPVQCRLFSASLHSSDDSKNEKPEWTAKAIEIAPGLAAAALVATCSFAAADGIGTLLLASPPGQSPISGIPVSIILGMGISNTLGLPAQLKPGLSFCSTTMLRTGIVCVGAKLSLVDVAKLGAVGIPVVTASMTAGLTFIPWAAKRAGLSNKLGSLLAAGTSICGVTAITAAAPAIRADSKETAVAVANVVAFGTLGMLTYPYFTHALLPESAAGLFLGVAVHDTSQVLGSAMTYHQVFGSDEVLKAAAVTKLTRNLCLAGVIPSLAWQYRHQDGAAVGGSEQPKDDGGAVMSGLAKFQKYVPGFVLGFIGVAALRSAGDYSALASGKAFGLFDKAAFEALAATVASTGSTVGLGTAMAAVGLSTSASDLKGVGVRPFAVGLSGALVVGSTGFATLKALEAAGALAAA